MTGNTDEPAEWAKAAAEEVVSKFCNVCFWDGACKPQKDGGCVDCKRGLITIAAIIARHAEERERVLRKAAEWASWSCPDTPMRNCSGDEGCDDDTAAQCWIDYWKKEA